MVYNMSCFICPVCKEKLNAVDKSYICPRNHTFDISKDGYVNLLMSQQSSNKRHGDDKLMVRARREFLEKGFYEPLQKTLCQVVSSKINTGAVIADVGCGEGYYTGAVAASGEYLISGIDISKDALKTAARSLKNCEFAVASAFALPYADKNIDCVLNVFAPSAYGEFFRVLKDDGYLIKVVPLSDHLWELKCALYEVPYKNKPEKRDEELFRLVSINELKYKITLNCNNDIMNLFKMTPYYYKTGRAETQKLINLDELDVTVHVGVEVYEKR